MRTLAWVMIAASIVVEPALAESKDTEFYESKIRPLFVKHCYKCHSESAKKREGGLLLDRRSGWLEGGDTDKAVVPGEPDASLLVKAVRYAGEDLQMPPDYQLAPEQVRLVEQWVRRGAVGPAVDLGDTQFSQLGDQKLLFEQAKGHWAFERVAPARPPESTNEAYNEHAIDRYVFARLSAAGLAPSPPADPRSLLRRLTYDLTGLPPTSAEVEAFLAESKSDAQAAVRQAVDRLLATPGFGEHFGRMWLDVARYADTDSFYRPDTRTPHYFPFAFVYRDYVVDAFNRDKPFDQFVREQLAADLMGLADDAPQLAALGFLAVGPHANRNMGETVDDWIDVTTRGLLGLTVACARCHDHKYEPIPTADYYALHGVFSSVVRIHPLNEKSLPLLSGYEVDEDDRLDYERKRKAIEAKIEKAGDKTVGGNRRSVAKKIRETELAELLLFHKGAPARMMVVKDKRQPVEPVVFLRGDPANQGAAVPRRYLTVLDSAQQPFPTATSGRLQLAEKIVAADNPLTARVFVNRVWGFVTGSHLVDTPSDFGLQGAQPTHPELLDWLAADFIAQGWSLKRLVRTIVTSRTYQQSSRDRAETAAVDPQNRLLWRANRKRLSIEAIRDSLLASAAQLDLATGGRAEPLWGKEYSRRRSIYGYINRFNLDPTLRVFDYPTPMQTQPARGETIVAPQVLFTMNAPFVIAQATSLVESDGFAACTSDAARVKTLFETVFQRQPDDEEIARIGQFVARQSRPESKQKAGVKTESPWPLVAQALLMSNEFQYVD